MEVKAITRNARISASKGRDLARAVQGKALADALRIVDFSPRKAAGLLGRTLRSGGSASPIEKQTSHVTVVLTDEK